jgi:MtN3 and saliva related transmembrane protein
MRMDWVTLLGLVAATCTTIAFLPQVIKTVRTKHTEDISLLMYGILTFGLVLWLIYGLLIWNLPIIAANSVILAFTLVILILKMKYG